MLQSRVPRIKLAERDSLLDEVEMALAKVHDEMLCETGDSVECLLAAWEVLEGLPTRGLPPVLRREWQSVARRVDLLKAGRFNTANPAAIGEAADVITILLCMEYAIRSAQRAGSELRLFSLAPARRQW